MLIGWIHMFSKKQSLYHCPTEREPDSTPLPPFLLLTSFICSAVVLPWDWVLPEENKGFGTRAKAFPQYLLLSLYKNYPPKEIKLIHVGTQFSNSFSCFCISCEQGHHLSYGLPFPASLFNKGPQKIGMVPLQSKGRVGLPSTIKDSGSPRSGFLSYDAAPSVCKGHPALFLSLWGKEGLTQKGTVQSKAQLVSLIIMTDLPFSPTLRLDGMFYLSLCVTEQVLINVPWVSEWMNKWRDGGMFLFSPPDSLTGPFPSHPHGFPISKMSSTSLIS